MTVEYRERSHRQPARRAPSRAPGHHLAPADQVAQYDKLLEMTRALASELDPAGLSHQVMLCAIDLIPAADAGTLYLADDVTGRLRVQDSIGLGPSIHQLSLEPGECAAGLAYFTGRGAIYGDPAAVAATLESGSAANLEAFRQATQGLRAPDAAISAPLIFKGDILGALVLDKFSGRDSRFTEQDLRLLEDLAQIAAIGIMNARQFDTERGARLRLQVMNEELSRQRDALDRRLRALDAMAQVAREDFRLEAIATRLAALACGSTIVADGLGRVRAAAPADLQAAAERLRDPDMAELMDRVSADRQRHAVIAGQRLLIASPVTGEPENLGQVILELSDTSSDGLPEALADSAALIASAVFVREQARDEGDLVRRGDLLSRLLNGDAPMSAAQFHDLRLPVRLAVGAVRPAGLASAAVAGRQAGLARQLRARTVEAAQNMRPASAIAMRDDHVVVAWSEASATPAIDRRAMFAAVAHQCAGTEGWHARFALTQPIADPGLVPSAYREALLALEVRPWGADHVIDVGELGAYRLIIGATSSTDAFDSSRQTLRAVLDHEEKRGSSLLPTLRAYIDLDMNVTAVSKALHIHVHTVQYRLAKIEELTGLSLHKGEQRLTLELSLRIYDLAMTSAPGHGQ